MFSIIVLMPHLSQSAVMSPKSQSSLFGRKNIRRGLPFQSEARKGDFQENLPQVPLFIPPVVGGHIAGQNSYPWLAALGTRTEAGGIQWVCGGSLISRTLILTAAHCIKIARIWVIIRQSPLPAMPNHQGALIGDVRFPYFLASK